MTIAQAWLTISLISETRTRLATKRRFKRSKIGSQFMNLAKMKMESFEKRAISPYGVRDETGRVEYFYGEYGGGYGVIV